MITIEIDEKTLLIPDLSLPQFTIIKGAIIELQKDKMLEEEIDPIQTIAKLEQNERLTKCIIRIVKKAKYDGRELSEEDMKVTGLVGMHYEEILSELVHYVFTLLEKKISNSKNTQADTSPSTMTPKTKNA